MVISQPLGLESYVAGHSPDFVSVHADPFSWVVAIYNKISRRTVAGYFKNPEESEEFRAMQLPVSDDKDLNGLEVKLLCVTPRQKSDASVTAQTVEQQWSNEKYLKAVFEGAGIPSQRIKISYARGSKLIHINMSTGKLQVRNVFEDSKPLEDDGGPHEPASMYPADPPEPNEERFWRARQRK